MIKLREAIEGHRRRTGERLTYAELAERTGLARTTIESLATRRGYNASLHTIEKVCSVLTCPLEDLLQLVPDEPRSAR